MPLAYTSSSHTSQLRARRMEEKGTGIGQKLKTHAWPQWRQDKHNKYFQRKRKQAQMNVVQIATINSFQLAAQTVNL